ncbi:MAG: hypothetical protein ACOCRX_04720 [Candidatus Woesearchaeota archaeon]
MSPAIEYSDIELKDSEQKYFLLSNKHGGFLTISNDLTNFQGWIEKENNYLKLVDKIRFDDDLIKIKNDYNFIREIYTSNSLKYQLFENGIKIELDKKDNISIDLDIREIYKNPTEGRVYEIKKENHKKSSELIIIYSKYETDQLEKLEYKKYISITGISNKEKVKGEWIKKKYNYDKRRNSKSVYYVYRLKDIETEKITISYSDNLKSSIDKSNFLYYHNLKPNYLFKIKNKKLSNSFLKIDHELLNLAYRNSYDGIRKLAFQEDNKTFFYAGHPWFFQIWTRDLLTSLSGIKEIDYNTYEDLIFNLDKTINETGMKNRIEFKHHKLIDLNKENKKNNWITNADSIGWYAKRVKDYLEEKIESNKELDYDFLKSILLKFSNHIKKILSNNENKIKYLKKNNPKQTWMDTIDRSGYRIEIQAQLIIIYDLIILISEYLNKIELKKRMRYFKQKSLEEIRNHFIKDGKVIDGFNFKKDKINYDTLTRPNVFLAYYINKNLFDNKVWEKTFDEVLKKNKNEFIINIPEKRENQKIKFSLISTLEYNKAIKHYTGENDESYHMGDSWYFINNIACISLYKINKEKYKGTINSIINSSIYDCTINNSFCSEVTSINDIKPYGCYNQLWSNATLIEFLKLVEKNN